MKAPVISLLLLLGGFAGGYLVTRPSASPVLETPAQAKTSARKSNPEARGGFSAKLAPATRMQGLAEKAGGLDSSQWPEFFRAQLDSPDSTRLAARLWAESDPDGFWDFLKEEKDPLMLDRFADGLMEVWVVSSPDGALAAACQVTEKQLGDKIRRSVVDSALDRDVQTGIRLAAKAGGFGLFSWGPREWMKKDPAATVKGLATLPGVSAFRDFLTYAVPVWAESDPAAALEWLKSEVPVEGDRWTRDSFEAVAKADTAAALEVARSFADPRQRDEALAGVLSGWKGDVEGAKEVVAELPLGMLGKIAIDVFFSRPSMTAEDLRESTRLLEVFPSSRQTLDVVTSLAYSWQSVDRAAGLQWANSLADPISRNRALKVLQSGN